MSLNLISKTSQILSKSIFIGYMEMGGVVDKIKEKKPWLSCDADLNTCKIRRVVSVVSQIDAFILRDIARSAQFIGLIKHI